MGGGNWTSQSWTSYSTSNINNKATSAIYTSKTIKEEYDPTKIQLRESRDSVDHPNSTPIIIGLDVTGSMGSILQLVAKKLGLLVGEILDRNPVKDPQIMFNAIGDVKCDNYPLQATQFESDIRIAEQLTNLYFEQGGGGNGSESYPLTWLFASRKVETDSFDKRGKKGFIFTIGDDGFPTSIKAKEAFDSMDINIGEDMSTETLLSEVSKKFEVYHLCLEQGGTYSESMMNSWRGLLGERAISVADYDKIPEIIVSILEVVSGKDKDDVLKSWSGDTAIVVSKALGSIIATTDSDLVEF